MTSVRSFAFRSASSPSTSSSRRNSSSEMPASCCRRIDPIRWTRSAWSKRSLASGNASAAGSSARPEFPARRKAPADFDIAVLGLSVREKGAPHARARAHGRRALRVLRPDLRFPRAPWRLPRRLRRQPHHVPGTSIAIRLGDEHLRKSPMCSLPLDSRCFRVDQRADDRVPEDDVSRCDLNEPGSFCGSERLANAQERRCSPDGVDVGFRRGEQQTGACLPGQLLDPR